MNDDVISRNAVLGLLLRIKAHASVAVLYETISKETENKVVEIVDMFAEQIQGIPALDAVPVVRCECCTLHGHCTVEDMFIFAGFTDGYCRAGKRLSNSVSSAKMGGEDDAAD